MQTYIIRRLLLFIPTILLITLVVFLFLRIIPGDPALLRLSGVMGSGTYTQEELDNLRHELGTDRPIHVQYGRWIWDMLHGDMGKSFTYRTEIVDLLSLRIPLTLELCILGILISFVIAVPLGIVSALAQDSPFDYLARVITLAGLSIPTYVVGMVTVYLLVRVFNWFPPLDYTPPWEDLSKNLQTLIFPALAIALWTMAFTARMTRSSMLEVMRQDYIRTARAKGLRERRVLFLHALKNSFLPILTVTGWSFSVLLAGEVIVEKIFLLPGMGILLLDSIFSRDYAVIQAEVFVVAGMVLLVNLTVDILYGWLDPRVRFT